MTTLQPFATWADVIAHVARGGECWYHAPLDVLPHAVRTELRKGGKVRVFPWTREADPFTADAGHLSRFRRKVERHEITITPKGKETVAKIVAHRRRIEVQP